MIRIEKIEIVEFRGIRRLELVLRQKNFGVCGPNGTGKSGVVDAIEFALTGNITRLGGMGTGEISVKAHAPHVDASTTPEKSWVRITGYLPSINKNVVIERSVKNSANPIITPNDAETRTALARLATHPEFALSRREIIKYILTPAGDRSKEVQALLRLDQVDRTRLSLQRIANDARRDATRAATDDERAKNDLIVHLQIDAPSKKKLLSAVNERRAILKLDGLADLTPGVSLKEGVAVAQGKATAPKIRLSKASASAELRVCPETSCRIA